MKDLTHSIVSLKTTLECDLIINECRYYFAYRTLMLESSTCVVIDFHNLQNQIICCQCLTSGDWCIYYLTSKMTKPKMKSWWYFVIDDFNVLFDTYLLFIQWSKQLNLFLLYSNCWLVLSYSSNNYLCHIYTWHISLKI